MSRWARLSMLLSFFLSLSAFALEPVVVSHSLVEDAAMDTQGLVSVNVGAGNLHQQLNARAIAIGTELAAATLRLQQHQMLNQLELNQDAQADLLGDAFANGVGVIGVNQAAGTGNQQINAFRFSLGQKRQDLDDSVLAQQLVAPAQSSGATDQPKGSRIVVTDDKAFAGSRGVVQLNQSAGVGNQSVNSLSMTVVD